MKIKLPHFTCQRCSHAWTPRTEKIPVICPRCKSPYWNRPRKEK